MEDIGDYIRLDSWADVEALGLEERFESHASFFDDWIDEELDNIIEDGFEATLESSTGYFKSKHSGLCSYRYAYVKKSSLPKAKIKKEK